MCSIQSNDALSSCLKCIKFIFLPHCRLLIILVLLVCSTLPFFAVNLPFSKMYAKKDDTLDVAREMNSDRLEKARSYFRATNYEESVSFYKNRYTGMNDLSLVVCIVTMNRHIPGTGYLLQTTAVIDNIIKKDNYFKNSLLILCNVDRDPSSHSDATLVQNYVPFVQKHGNNSFGKSFHFPEFHSQHSDPKRGRETGDYMYCLNVSRSFGSPYILMLEDDVVPYRNIFQVLNFTIKHHLLHSSHSESFIHRNRQFAFLKLYYPERWLGYANEPDRVLELISIGLVGGGILLLIILARANLANTSLHYCAKLFYFTFGAIFTMLVASVFGRQNIMDLRRISPQLFKFGPTPACCTPAMFYSSHIIPPLINHLMHHSDMNKDLAINDFIVKNDIPGFILEPNLVRHIGMYTSLKNAYKPPEEFLFHLPIP